MPPCEPVFQVIESGLDGENLENLSMETTVLNVHYVIHIIGFHVTLMRPDWQRSTLAVLLWWRGARSEKDVGELYLESL